MHRRLIILIRSIIEIAVRTVSIWQFNGSNEPQTLTIGDIRYKLAE
jgi:hypothetical protein